MRYKKGLEEVGKAIINIGVASVVFAVIQPVVNDKFSPTLSVGAVLVFIVLATVGFLCCFSWMRL